MTTPRWRIVVADDHALVAEALADTLRQSADVVTVLSLSRLEAVVRENRPDLLLLDLGFGRRSALPVLESLLRAHPDLRVIIVTAHDEAALADAALRIGAKGYVLKRGDLTELSRAMHEVIEGGTFVSDQVQARGGGSKRLPDEAQRFTERQREVLVLIRRGCTSPEIGAQLHISHKTVDRHVDDMCAAIGVRGRHQLIRWADAALPDRMRRPS